MELVDLSDLPEADVARYGSVGFRVGTLLAGHSQVSAATLAPGGSIGRHAAPAAQLLVVLSGSVEVAGGDGELHRLEAPHAARWAEGEEHETVAHTGASLLIVEGAFSQS